jgi:hypothetical protein
VGAAAHQGDPELCHGKVLVGQLSLTPDTACQGLSMEVSSQTT